jgi:PEGA domain-containing protein
MRPSILTVILVVALHAAWSGSSARADGIVLVTGTASPRQREIVVDAFEATATSLRWKLTAPSLARELVDASVKCLTDSAPWTCVAPQIRGNDQIVIIQLESERGASVPTTIATAHVLIAGIQGDISASRYSETGNEEAFKRASADLSKLLQDAAERTGRTKLVIRSKPDKAWVTLDGQNIGATENTRATYPGLHTLSVRRIGYKAMAREVIAIEGKVITEDFELESDGPPTSSDDRNHLAGSTSRLIPKLAVGMGGAIIAAGVFWLVYNDKLDPHGHQQRYYHDTSRYGYVSLAAGVVTASVGLYFWLRPDAASAAVVAPVRGGGASASWVWRF